MFAGCAAAYARWNRTPCPNTTNLSPQASTFDDETMPKANRHTASLRMLVLRVSPWIECSAPLVNKRVTEGRRDAEDSGIAGPCATNRTWDPHEDRSTCCCVRHMRARARKSPHQCDATAHGERPCDKKTRPRFPPVRSFPSPAFFANTRACRRCHTCERDRRSPAANNQPHVPTAGTPQKPAHHDQQ